MSFTGRKINYLIKFNSFFSLMKKSTFCPSFVRKRYDLRKWRPSSSGFDMKLLRVFSDISFLSEHSSSGARRTISSKISVNPSSGGLAALDDSFFQASAVTARANAISKSDLATPAIGEQPKKTPPQPTKRQSGIAKIREIARRRTTKTKESDWVRNSEAVNDAIERTLSVSKYTNFTSCFFLTLN